MGGNAGAAVIGLGFTLFFILAVLTIALAVAGGIYMLACLLLNLLGTSFNPNTNEGAVSSQAGGWSQGGKPVGNPYASMPPNASKNPYAAPHSVKSVRGPAGSSLVPVPSFANAMVVVLLTALGAFVLWLGMVTVGGLLNSLVRNATVALLTGLLALALQLAGNVGLMSLIGSKFLPTTIGRSALVALLFYLIYFAIAFFFSFTMGFIGAILF